MLHGEVLPSSVIIFNFKQARDSACVNFVVGQFLVRSLRKGLLLPFFAVISKARGANFNVRLNLYRGALAELGAVLVV